MLPFHFGGGGNQHIERGGFPNSNSQSPNPQCPQQRGTLSGTSFSATLRPGWALANPRLSKSRGSLPPTPGLSPVLSCPVLSWTGLVASCCNCPGLVWLGVCCQAGCQVIRLSACCPMPAVRCRTARPFIPLIHPNPPACPHHITLPTTSMNQPGRPAPAPAPRLVLS